MGRDASWRLGIAGFVVASLCGCVSTTSVRESEIFVVNESNLHSVDGAVAYADGLANKYIELADRASVAQDGAALAIIGAGAVAGGALLYNGSLDLVKGAGLAAGSVTATSNYFRPGESASHLLDSAEQLICISKAGNDFPREFSDDLEAIRIIRDGVATVRVTLRQKLRRTLPDYKTLVNNLKSSIESGGANFESGIEGKGESIDKLRTEVAACVI